MKYKYYITYNSTTQEVSPLGVDKLKIVGESEEGRIFVRRKVSGRLIFIKSDYIFFKAIDDDPVGKCDEIKLTIKRSCDKGVTYADFWYGYFSTTDGAFDIDRCIFDVEPLPDDEYRCFLEGFKTEIGFQEVQQMASSGNVPDVLYEYYVCRDTIGNCNSGLPEPHPLDTWLPFHTETIGGSTTTIYYREIVVTPCEDGSAVRPPGVGWFEVTDSPPSCINEGLTKWVRQPQDIVVYNPNPDVIAGFCDNGTPIAAKTLYITKSNSSPTPLILGKNIIQVTGVSLTREYYYIKYPKANSTYLWSIGGAGGNVIFGPATGSSVVVDINTADTISVIETTPCGASSAASQAFTICGGSGCSTYNSEVKVLGNLEMCVGETTSYYLNGETGRVPIIAGGSSVGSTINVLSSGQGTHGLFEITAGTAGTIAIIWSGGGARDSSTTPTITITVKEKKNTPIAYGPTQVCKSSQANYEVSQSSIGTYVWYIEGGTIDSGQNTNQISVTWDGNTGIGKIAVMDVANCMCDFVQIADCGYSGEPPFFLCRDNNKNFDRNWLLQTVINKIKDTICASISNVKSDFFQWNNPGDTPGYISGINYVTQDTNKLKYVTIAPTYEILYINDIISGSKGADTKEKISWELIEKIMLEVFNCFWFIENGSIRIEHYSWFHRTVKFDLTAGGYLVYIKGKNIYSYEKIKAPKYERFKWAQALNTDFVGAEISYSGNCINQDQLTSATNRGEQSTTTDLIYLFSGAEEIKSDGITMMVNNYDGAKYTLLEEAGDITGIVLPNAHMSWANLHYNYHRHGRSILTGKMNLISQVFLSAIRYKKQEAVKFPFCCDDTIIPEDDLIVTSVGSGVVSKYEFNFKDDTITVDLLHT